MMSREESPGEACDRFFSIDELVSIFLHQAPTTVLVNCLRVCTLWHTITTTSPVLQERLFLKPASRTRGRYGDCGCRRSGNLENNCTSMAFESPTSEVVAKNDGNEQPRPTRPHRSTPQLNPVLVDCFASVLSPSVPGNSEWTTYADLFNLRWAKTGTELTSRSRQAFAREEASWRRMFVCQPPITRLDWWHSWRTHDGRWEGWGHQFHGSPGQEPLTLGTLWDLVESRLRRGCEVQLWYFPSGKAIEDDATAGEMEREFASWTDQHHGYTPKSPRVKLVTKQTWDALPTGSEMYNLDLHRWEQRNEVDEVSGHSNRHWDGDGFNMLRNDCHQDRNTQRWSRSEGYRWVEINGESSSPGREVL